MAEGFYIPESEPIYEVRTFTGMTNQNTGQALLKLTLQNLENTDLSPQELFLVFESNTKARDFLKRCLSHYR